MHQVFCKRLHCFRISSGTRAALAFVAKCGAIPQVELIRTGLFGSSMLRNRLGHLSECSIRPRAFVTRGNEAPLGTGGVLISKGLDPNHVFRLCLLDSTLWVGRQDAIWVGFTQG